MNLTERTSLHLEELGSRIATNVTQRGPEGLTVTQELPFLRLTSAVRDENGRRASIDWISVDIDGDKPSLVMELSYLAPEREDATMPCFRITPSPGRRDETVPFEIENLAPRREIVVGASATAPHRSFEDQLIDAWDVLRRDVVRGLHALAHRLAPA